VCQVYESLNREGVYCSLVTGQEKRRVPFANHTAATIETANLNVDFDVAVIDEIQMIAHPERSVRQQQSQRRERPLSVDRRGGLGWSVLAQRSCWMLGHVI
jgi:hypothetical protein